MMRSDDFPKAADFWACIYDGRPWMSAQYHWSGSENVTIGTPDAQTTTATLGGVSGFDYCWLDVTTRVGGYDLTSSIWCRVRTNETPQVSTSLTCSDIVFLNDGYTEEGEIVNGGFRAERVYPVRFKLNCPEATNAVVTLSVDGNVVPRLYADAACETPLADTTFEMAAGCDFLK